VLRWASLLSSFSLVDARISSPSLSVSCNSDSGHKPVDRAKLIHLIRVVELGVKLVLFRGELIDFFCAASFGPCSSCFFKASACSPNALAVIKSRNRLNRSVYFA
jgi:hypothetical protein